MKCIYCDQDKRPQDFSLEHILPARLGGGLCSDLFKTRSVCRDCNSKLGAFVDGAFIKNWFRTNDEVNAAMQYLDLGAPNTTMPLAYVGALQSLKLSKDDICELWLGACGARYYHIHKRDDPRWDTYAGGNPMSRKQDPGRVFLLLTTHNTLWIALSIRSMKQYFPKARRYAGNFAIQDDSAADPFVHAMDEVAQLELTGISALGDREHMARTSIDVGFDYRFTAKLALGFGANILGVDFLDTSYSKQLRDALWSRNSDSRANITMRGRGFFSGPQDDVSTRVLSWNGAYTVVINAMPDVFALGLFLPSNHSLHVVISDAPSLWRSDSFAPYRQGIVFVIVPQLGTFTGPLALPEYVAHRIGSASHPALTALEAKRIDPATLPPCQQPAD